MNDRVTSFLMSIPSRTPSCTFMTFDTPVDEGSLHLLAFICADICLNI